MIVLEILIGLILDPPEVIVHEATNNTDDIVYTLQQVEKIEAGFQCNIVCKIFLMCNKLLQRLLKCNIFVVKIAKMQHFWKPNSEFMKEKVSLVHRLWRILLNLEESILVELQDFSLTQNCHKTPKWPIWYSLYLGYIY